MNTKDKTCDICAKPCGEYPRRRGYLFDDAQGVARGGMLAVCSHCWVWARDHEVNEAARKQREAGHE